ncbi:MAG: hypothetical protein ACI9FN_002316 [Saprospiraceae bacterium]|jgi:hypothetical protein
MKNYKKLSFKLITLIICVISFTPACTDLSEEVFSEVTSDNFFQTEEELIAALGEAYTAMYGYAYGGYGATQEVSSDELTVPTRGPDWGDGGHWVRLHQHNWTSEDPEPNGAYGFLFGAVSTCNRLIFQFEELGNPLTEPFIGELKGLRAVYYMWLLDLFGNVPIVTGFADADPSPATNSRAEVYAFVESELLENLTKVPSVVDGTTYGRVNQMVIQTALAKLYLNAEIYTGTPQWQKAITACNAVINSGNFSMESDYFANFAIENSGSSEFIMAIPYDAVNAGGNNLVMRTLSYLNQQTYDLAAQPWNGWCTMEDFYNSYEDGDLRKGTPNTEDGPSTQRSNFLIGPQWDVTGKVRLTDAGTLASGVDPDGEPFTIRAEVNELFPNAWREAGARVSKYEFEIGGRDNMNNDYPVFRYTDIIMMKAEGLWRLDPGSSEALALMNMVRERVEVVPFTALTAENILAERGRELFVENHRRTDLIRFGKFTEAWWEKPADEACKTLMPIPKSQIDANPNLVQNPCY